MQKDKRVLTRQDEIVPVADYDVQGSEQEVADRALILIESWAKVCCAFLIVTDGCFSLVRVYKRVYVFSYLCKACA